MGPRAYEKRADLGSAFESPLAQAIASGLTKAKERAQRAGGQAGQSMGAALRLAAGGRLLRATPDEGPE